jgi:hypothetical protein
MRGSRLRQPAEHADRLGIPRFESVAKHSHLPNFAIPDKLQNASSANKIDSI